MCHYIWQYGSATLGGDIWFSCWSDHEKTIFGAIEEAIYLLNRNDLSKSKWAGGGLQKCGPAVLQVKSSMMALVWRSCVELGATKQQLWENSDRVCHLAHTELILHCRFVVIPLLRVGWKPAWLLDNCATTATTSQLTPYNKRKYIYLRFHFQTQPKETLWRNPKWF